MTTATDTARESAEPRGRAVELVCAMPSEPTADALAAFRQAVDEKAFWALLRRMVAEMETEHDVTAA
jgi:hypothetical protein